tara:strand:+ start:157 stop:843 length:687 start_codon:yes stop_codon:yes gene_type:complete
MHVFQDTKTTFKKAFQEILAAGDSYEIGEAALPAYAHKNPFIDWLFWQRIKVSFQYAQQQQQGGNVLDFGCGSGILSYLLAKAGYNVTACDVEFSPLRLVQQKITFPENISFVEGDILTQGFPKHSFDMIFALDVLEHIDDLEPYIAAFNELLTPNGLLVVSGPTENRLYKMGRKLAGKRFTGDYHVSNISNIKEAFRKTFPNISSKKLIFPFILFEIFAVKKADAPQ